MNRTCIAIATMLEALSLTGCGSSTGERAKSGGGIGAGVGALVGFMVGAPLEGALIGGVVGAGTGALTTQHQIDLGRPIWK